MLTLVSQRLPRVKEPSIQAATYTQQPEVWADLLNVIISNRNAFALKYYLNASRKCKRPPINSRDQG